MVLDSDYSVIGGNNRGNVVGADKMSGFAVRWWDTQSTDYCASEFHEEHGAGYAGGLDVKRADMLFGVLCNSPNISRAVVFGPEGTLSWDRHEPTAPEFIGQDVDADNF